MGPGALALLGEAEGMGLVQRGEKRASWDLLIGTHLAKAAAF